MRTVSLFIAVGLAIAGITVVQAAGTQKEFVESVDKALKISGQMANGKVPYNAKRAAKEMGNLAKAVDEFEAGDMKNVPKQFADCAKKLKIASIKGVAAAKAGQGAFKAVYGTLVKNYKKCIEKK